MTVTILCAEIDAPGGMIYVASRPYASHPSDTPSSEFFGRDAVDIVYERALSFEIWSRSGGGTAISGIELVNLDGFFDGWLNLAWKGRRVVFKAVVPCAAYSTAIEVGSMVIQGVRAPSLRRFRLDCGSTLELLKKPINKVYSQSIYNSQLRGQARPIVLGRVRWADHRPQRLANGSIRGLHDVTDDHFESIVQLLKQGVPETEQPSPLLPFGGGYFVDSDECYGFRYCEQLDRLAVEFRGNLRRESNAVTNDSFPTASGGGHPAGWTVTTTGSASVVWNSPANVTIAGSAETARITQVLTLTAGRLYQLELRVISQSGTANLYKGDGTVLRSFEGLSSRTITGVFTAAGGGADVARVGLDSSQSGYVQIAHFRCYPVTRIDSLGEVLRFAAGRLSITDAEIDLTACDAIQAASNYRIAVATNQALTGESLARKAALSYGCGLFQDRYSKLRPARLAAPAVTADFEILSSQVLGDPSVEIDMAPGLSNRMSYGRNYVVHAETDMPGVTDPALRAALTREIRIATSTVALHALYAFDATGRDPFDSLLSEQADAQAEIDRICALYTGIRVFLTLRARVDDAVTAYLIEPGQTVRLTHRRFGLSSGRNFLVVLARSDFTTSGVDLVLWGSLVDDDEVEEELRDPDEELVPDPDLYSTDGWLLLLDGHSWSFDDGAAIYDGGAFPALQVNLTGETVADANYRFELHALVTTPEAAMTVVLNPSGQVIYSGPQPAVDGGEAVLIVDFVAVGGDDVLYITPEESGPMTIDTISLTEQV